MAINKLRLAKRMPAIKESEVIHQVLNFALQNIELKDFNNDKEIKRLGQGRQY